MAEGCSLKARRRILKGPQPLARWESNHSTSQVGRWRGNPLCVLQGPGERGQVASWTFRQICFSTQPSSAGFINHSATLPSTLVWAIGFSGVVITRMLRAKVWSRQIGPLCLPYASPSLSHLYAFPQGHRVSTPTHTSQGSRRNPPTETLLVSSLPLSWPFTSLSSGNVFLPKSSMGTVSGSWIFGHQSSSYYLKRH